MGSFSQVRINPIYQHLANLTPAKVLLGGLYPTSGSSFSCVANGLTALANLQTVQQAQVRAGSNGGTLLESNHGASRQSTSQQFHPVAVYIIYTVSNNTQPLLPTCDTTLYPPLSTSSSAGSVLVFTPCGVVLLFSKRLKAVFARCYRFTT
jgi:hypothetical protein